MVQATVVAGLTLLLPIDEEDPETVPTAPRLHTFNDKVIGFLSNTKDNIDHLFAAMQTQLEAAYTPKGVIHRAKEHFATPASHTLLEELQRTCDAVIVAAGA